MSTLETLPSKTKTLLQTLYSDENGAADDSVIASLVAGASVPAIEFPENADWINSGPLTIHGNLQGRYVLLDFFTYCCINCMHILPALHQLEEDVGEGLVVVGVHSGKFSNEKSNENILNAVSRYKISHAVLNDQHYDMWNSYSIVCWPTLVLINPAGKIVLVSIGESDVDKVVRFVKDAVRVSPPIEIQLASPPHHTLQVCGPKKVLSYPGKVYYHASSNTVFIADSYNNRIVQTNTRGEILKKYPSCPSSPPLDTPQGVRVFRGSLYVCDTNNHRVVSIDLETGELEVRCGTGVQGHDLEGGKSGRAQEMSSPWDLEVVSLQHVPGCQGDLLMVAMAGTHQIWAYALTDVTIDHRGESETRTKGRCWRVAGSGDEANKNNSYPHKAAFAQPSGISYDEGKFVYIADSESSTVRSLELPSFAVKNVAGGGLDPSDLFAYGDEDGKGTAAKFQHPIGVTYTRDNTLLVADSYNHRIKLVDTKTRVVSTVQDVTGLSEPSGVSYDRYSNRVYVADTNNHSIRVVDLGSLRSEELGISDRMRFSENSGVSWVGLEGATTLTLHLSFPNKLNTSAPSNISITPLGGATSCGISHEVPVTGPVVLLPLAGVEGDGALELFITLYTCSGDGTCYMNKYTHRINLVERATEIPLRKGNEALVIQLN